MDGNKDDALKCVRIGKEALNKGDRSRALKFFSKARSLAPTLPIDDLLSMAAKGEPQNPLSADYDAPSEAPLDDTSSSASSTGARARVSSNWSSRSYTEEQLTIVKQIKKQRDYYQILGLERGCTVEDVRKAYRKLSLKVHPDKNRAPGADEAFKAVAKSFQCLSEEQSRKRYDLLGSEEETAHVRPAGRHRAHGFNGFNDADIDAEEIFRSFFFGGVPRATTSFGTFQFRTGGTGGPTTQEMHGSGNFNLRTLIQILPVILFLLLNFLPSTEPIYALSRSYQYEHKVETPRGVPYFVKSAKFEEDYPYQSSERVALERRIERDYIGIVTQNCRLELQHRHWGLSHQTPHCDMLRQFEATA